MNTKYEKIIEFGYTLNLPIYGVSYFAAELFQILVPPKNATKTLGNKNHKSQELESW